jgi:protein-L-isoaspartate(D-aspartate) O-methyltransferase
MQLLLKHSLGRSHLATLALGMMCLGVSACQNGLKTKSSVRRAAEEAEIKMTRFANEKPEATAARAALVRQLAADGSITDSAVLSAIARVPRHELTAPGTSLDSAYGDHPLSIGHGQTISQPYIVALMTQALAVTGPMLGKARVLEIGTGSAYQSAVLSLLCQHVHSIEVIPELAHAAQAQLVRLGYHNVDVHLADGYRGWPAGAPYDRIILTAAPLEVPKALFDQLTPDGILVAPVGATAPLLGYGEQRLVRWRKHGGELLREDLGGVRFVPMVPKD